MLAYLLLGTLGIMEPAFWYRSLNTITCLTGIWVRVAFSEQKTYPHLSFANQFSMFGANCPLWGIDLSVTITVNEGSDENLGFLSTSCSFGGRCGHARRQNGLGRIRGPYRIMNR